MRICILSPDRPSQGLNGPLRTADETSRSLAALGHDVHVIGCASSTPRVQQIDGVWRHGVKIVDRALSGLEDCSVAMDLYAAAAKYREVLELHVSTPVDLVVAAIWPGEGLVCMLDERLTTVTLLVTPVKLMVDRGMLPQEPYAAMTRLETAVVERMRHIHATTSAIVADVEATFNVRLEPSDLVPLFVSDRAGTPGVERYAKRDGIEVLFVGRAEPRKGADVLVAAAEQLATECPNAVFVLVGSGDWDSLRRKVERAGLSARVRFLGEVDEERLWRLYAGADVVCVPSRYESFGYALNEGMMFGKAIVATNVGGMSSTVEDGGNALLCPPDDSVALADRLRRLILDTNLREAFGRRSRELYLDRYSAERGGERTAALYRSIAASGRPTPAPSIGTGDDAAARMAEALAAAIADIAQLEPGSARNVAQALLAPPGRRGDVATNESPLGVRTDDMELGSDWQTRALEAERQNAELRATLESLVHSKSWRLTKPLRDFRLRSRRSTPHR